MQLSIVYPSRAIARILERQLLFHPSWAVSGRASKRWTRIAASAATRGLCAVLSLISASMLEDYTNRDISHDYDRT